MNPNPSKPRVGILATMTELYRQIPTLQPRMERWASELITAMGSFAEVIYPGVCDTRDQVNRAVVEIQSRGAELIIVFPLTYAPSHLVLPSLRMLRLPVLLLNSQILRDFSAEADEQAFIENQAPTGLFDLSNVLVRSGIPFRVASGHYRDPKLLEELQDWCRVAQVAAAVRHFRIGLIGHPMDGMGDLAVDHTLFLAQVGAEVLHIPVAEVAAKAESAQQAEINRQMEEDHQRFEVDPDLSLAEHEASSRLEYAFRSIVRDYRLDGFSFHFGALHADGRIKTIPVLAGSKLLAEGCGYAGEGDVPCATAVAMLARLAGQADFFETWGLDFAGEAVMKNHMGEGNYQLARKDLPVRLMRAPVRLGGTLAPAAPCCVLQPGEATFVNLTTTRGGRAKLTVCEGSVPETRPIPGVRTPHGKFKPDLPLKEFLERYCLAGGSHHGALAYGRWSRSMERLAWILGLEFERI